MKYEDMIKWMKKCEGFNPNPYLDTVGKVTIGYGRNLDANGISEIEAEFMLRNDIARAEQDLRTLDWYREIPEGIQDALINMCFNLGLTRFLTFKRMIEALKQKDWTRASIEALDSKWASQVHDRAKDIAVMIRSGV